MKTRTTRRGFSSYYRANMEISLSYRHVDGVAVTAEFAREAGLIFRYRLEVASTNHLATGKTACVVMQNPSYASEDIADKSVQFMEKVVFEKGLPEFRGAYRLIVVNQFARVQTNGFRGLPEEIGPRNDQAIKEALQESDIIVLGWGSSNRFEERKALVYTLLEEMSGKTLLQTRMHPSRGRYEGFIQPFRRK